jgi:two-component system nitrate/nitrite response regulator NarL
MCRAGIGTGNYMASAHLQHPTLLVGQSSLLLEGIARLLEDTEFQVIARASSVDRLRMSDLQRHSSILLILEGSGGVASTVRQVEAFKRLHGEPRIAVITRVMRITDVPLLFRAGINACFDVGTPPTIFLKSLELVVLGKTILPPTISSSRSEVKAQRAGVAPGGPARLTGEEWRILRSLAEGQANEIIARQLGADEATVKIHVQNIFRKIGVANRRNAARWAKSSGAPEISDDEGSPIEGKTAPH